MLSKLDRIKQRVSGKSEEGDITTSLYYLIKELKCLPDILGREFEVEYNEKGNISRIIQKPMSIPSLMILFKEMEKDYKKQEREMRKAKNKGRRK